jgi:hypothetical protein
MTLIFAAIAIALGAWIVWPQVAKFRAGSAAERAFTIRFTVFAWLVGFLFAVAFLFLPNKGRVVMLLPAFLAAVSLAKWWKNSRSRLRREAGVDANFRRARRIN